MKWSRRGLIFHPTGEFPWMRSHAQIPTVLNLGEVLRVYFATRPQRNLSLTGFVDLDARDPSRIKYLHDKPVLELGPPGSFDAHGIMPQSVCVKNDQIWLYYGGWSRRVDIPYSNWTGLAVSNDGGLTFEKMFPGPILDRTPHEIYSATGCCVLEESNGWHMWYASGIDWVEVDQKLEEQYVVKYAKSEDGITWSRENRQLLKSNKDIEATHRPAVVKFDDLYHMWFCHRGITDFRNGRNSYRLGYARSRDGRKWSRDDLIAGLDVATNGWDSNMIAYPQVVITEYDTYLFYNGNGFGETGFGFAVLR